MTAPIHNEMRDCGGGRHVGWWSEDNLGPQHMLIEVEADTVIFACCEGERAEKRISFIVNRERAEDIARALVSALGIGNIVSGK